MSIIPARHYSLMHADTMKIEVIYENFWIFSLLSHLIFCLFPLFFSPLVQKHSFPPGNKRFRKINIKKIEKRSKIII